MVRIVRGKINEMARDEVLEKGETFILCNNWKQASMELCRAMNDTDDTRYDGVPVLDLDKYWYEVEFCHLVDKL